MSNEPGVHPAQKIARAMEKAFLYGEGYKDDQQKLRYDLMPVEAEAEVIKVLTHGAQKYADHNWRQGIVHARTIAAALRHIKAFQHGEKKDEIGTHHLANAICELLFCLQFELEGRTELDNLSYAKRVLSREIFEG